MEYKTLKLPIWGTICLNKGNSAVDELYRKGFQIIGFKCNYQYVETSQWNQGWLRSVKRCPLLSVSRPRSWDSPTSNLMFHINTLSVNRFLVDTGASVSVFPHRSSQPVSPAVGVQLRTSNQFLLLLEFSSKPPTSLSCCWSTALNLQPVSPAVGVQLWTSNQSLLLLEYSSEPPTSLSCCLSSALNRQQYKHEHFWFPCLALQFGSCWFDWDFLLADVSKCRFCMSTPSASGCSWILPFGCLVLGTYFFHLICPCKHQVSSVYSVVVYIWGVLRLACRVPLCSPNQL